MKGSVFAYRENKALFYFNQRRIYSDNNTAFTLNNLGPYLSTFDCKFDKRDSSKVCSFLCSVTCSLIIFLCGGLTMVLFSLTYCFGLSVLF